MWDLSYVLYKTRDKTRDKTRGAVPGNYLQSRGAHKAFAKPRKST